MSIFCPKCHREYDITLFQFRISVPCDCGELLRADTPKIRKLEAGMGTVQSERDKVKNILITGKPGIGKTTLIKNICKSIQLSKGGFYTEEIRAKGARMGFKIITFNGVEGILSHVEIKSSFRVGKYKVDIESFESMGVRAIEDAIRGKELIVIDEIGKMELYSDKFKEAVIKALNSDKRVLATIRLGSDNFIIKIKERTDIKIFELTPDNKADIKDRIIYQLTKVE